MNRNTLIGIAIVIAILAGILFWNVESSRVYLVVIVVITVLGSLIISRLRKDLGCLLEFVGIVGSVILIAIIGPHFFNMLPNPTRTLEQLTPCLEMLKRIGAEESEFNENPYDRGCLTADMADFQRVISNHTTEWSDANGSTAWTMRQIQALIPMGDVNNLDLNAFRWERTNYDKAVADYWAVTRWKLGNALLVIGISLTIGGYFISYLMSLTPLAPISQFGFPILIILSFIAGLGGMYFPWLGILPTDLYTADDIKTLFWIGFGINAGAAILGVFLSAASEASAQSHKGGFVIMVLNSIIAIPLIALVGGFVVNQMVTSNIWLSNNTAHNALYLGYLFASPIVGTINSFLSGNSD